jgi:hypothetical protein
VPWIEQQQRRVEAQRLGPRGRGAAAASGPAVEVLARCASRRSASFRSACWNWRRTRADGRHDQHPQPALALGVVLALGHICLNWRLVQMPAAVRDYVLIHELMHLKRMDHSRAFWKLVAAACPAYKKARAWLRSRGAH